MRSIIKRLVPTAVADLLRCARECRQRMRTPFAGVYERFVDVPQRGHGFDDKDWVDTAVAYAISLRKRSEDNFIAADIADEKALLPLVVAMLAGQGRIRIVDFGGATGFSYLALKLAVPLDVEFDYLVVEHRSICDAAKPMFADEPAIRFATELPSPGDVIDIFLIGASLQYIADYTAFLSRVVGLKPRYVLFTKLPAGENPTYATAQVNLKDKQHAHWLFNVHEIAGLLTRDGYRLVFKSAVAGEVNQRNFEAKQRIDHFCNLLFERWPA